MQITCNLMRQLLGMFTNPQIIQAVMTQLNSSKSERGVNHLEWQSIRKQIQTLSDKYGCLLNMQSGNRFKQEPMQKMTKLVERALISCLKVMVRINKLNPSLIQIDDYLRSLDQFYGNRANSKKCAAKENFKWLYNLYIKGN